MKLAETKERLMRYTRIYRVGARIELLFGSVCTDIRRSNNSRLGSVVVSNHLIPDIRMHECQHIHVKIIQIENRVHEYVSSILSHLEP
jgi:hypothetical protein